MDLCLAAKQITAHAQEMRYAFYRSLHVKNDFGLCGAITGFYIPITNTEPCRSPVQLLIAQTGLLKGQRSGSIGKREHNGSFVDTLELCVIGSSV